jgi:hypothetical protein
MYLFLNNEWREWTKDCYFFILTGTPCQAISRGARLTGRRKFGLHAMPSKLWHVAYAGIYHLQILIGIARLITFSENVIPGNAADLKELDEQSGFRYSMDSTPNEGIARQRYLWSNRKIPFVIKLPRDMTTDKIRNATVIHICETTGTQRNPRPSSMLSQFVLGICFRPQSNAAPRHHHHGPHQLQRLPKLHYIFGLHEF